MGETESLTILKYRVGKAHLFHVMDKFDEEDEPKRLDRMIEFSNNMAKIHGEDYEQLWIKTCPIFPTR